MRTTKKIIATTGVLAATAALGAVAVDANQGTASRLPRGAEVVKLDPAKFSTNITNRWFPMKPGNRWIYNETDAKGAKRRVVVTVTNKTKKIANGVTARVVTDVVTEGGKPVEVTDDWYAQDRAGNVWYFGEDTAEYENGKVKTRAGSFEAGKRGAQPGILIPAKPKVGQRYREEYLKGEAEDRAEIFSFRQQAEVPFGYFRPGRLVMTRNTTPVEPKVLEYKFLARGIGPVLELGVSGGSDRAELVSFTRGK